MNLKQLERFIVAAEHGNIAAAALQLNLSQPALTRSIQMLEDTLGAPLFERLPRGVTLTPLGTKILPYARLLVRERTRIKEAVDEFNGSRGGSISFGATDNLLDGSASAITQFRDEHPATTVVVRSDSVGELFAGLRDGSLDLALATLGSHAIPDDLCFERLFEALTSVVARGQHPLASQARVTFQELAREKWLIIGGTVAEEGLRLTFQRHEAPPPLHAIRCDSLSFVKSCLLADDYVAMLDQHYIARELRSGAIRALSLDGAGIALASGLVYRKNVPRMKTINSFMNAIRRCVRREDSSNDGSAGNGRLAASSQRPSGSVKT